jgi:hypothetical protein
LLVRLSCVLGSGVPGNLEGDGATILAHACHMKLEALSQSAEDLAYVSGRAGQVLDQGSQLSKRGDATLWGGNVLTVTAYQNGAIAFRY